MEFKSFLLVYGIGFLIWQLIKTDYTKWDDTPIPIKEPKANLDMQPILKSYYLLQIQSNTEWGLIEVEQAYQKKISEIAEIKKNGFTPFHDLSVIESAREVLTDYYKYAAYRN